MHAVGIFDDGWVEKTAVLDLAQGSGEQVLSVRGMVPQIADPAFRGDIRVSVDSNVVADEKVGIGEFRISAPVDRATGSHRVTLEFGATQELPGGDGRAVGAKLSFLGFEKASASSDIVRGAAVRLGDGWGQTETYSRDVFRWVNNDAKVLVNAARSGDYELKLTVAPGPGIDGPFVLKVLDSGGRQVASSRVSRHTAVAVIVPVNGGRSNEFALHIDGGGKPAKNGDPRIMNFRVFQIEATPVASKSN